MEMNFAPKSTQGIATAGLVTGIVGAVNALGSSGLGGLLGNNGMYACSDNMPVSRYELSQEKQIAELKSEIALRDANIYNDNKALELYRYIDGKLSEIQGVLGAQAVQNQATKDSFGLLQERLECECKARNAADAAIVNYANATFYAKQISDITVGTTSTAQTTYNPLPACSC